MDFVEETSFLSCHFLVSAYLIVTGHWKRALSFFIVESIPNDIFND